MPKELNYCIVQRGRKPSWEIKHLAQVFYLGKTPAELSQEMFSTPSGLMSALYPNLRRRGPDGHLWDLINFFPGRRGGPGKAFAEEKLPR